MTTTPTPGTRVSIRKYGSVYPAYLVRTTPTRALVRFTTKAGRAKEMFIPLSDVLGKSPY